MNRVSHRVVLRVVASSVMVGMLVACTGTQGPAGPALTGDRAGVVYLFDQFGGYLSSNAGISVAANPGNITSTTDAAGQYALVGLKTGTYTISFTGTGFGTFLQPRVGFVGGGTAQVAAINMAQQSTAVISALVATPSATGDTIVLTGTLNAPPAGVTRSIRLFFSASATPSATVGAYALTTVKAGFAASPFTYRLTGADIQSLRNNFAAASTVYVVAYGDSFYENSYEDSTSGQTVYPNVSAPSNITTFTMP
jgi:hypothetical protein